MRRPHTHSAGFTILELMITVSILAILLGIGVPAFGDIIRNNRLATETNNLVGALNMARAEAAKRGIPVAICAASAPPATPTNPPAPPTCAGGTTTNWNNGWLVFTDRIGDVGIYNLPATADDPSDELLLVSKPVAQGISVATVAESFARFMPGSTPIAAVAFTVRPTDSLACAKTGRRVVGVQQSGRINLDKPACSS